MRRSPLSRQSDLQSRSHTDSDAFCAKPIGVPTVTLKALGQRAVAVEGYRGSEWVLVDYFDFVVHVFTPESREFYALERLWGSAIRVEVSDEPAAVGGGRRPA